MQKLKSKIRTQNTKVFATLFSKSMQVWAEPTREKRSRREIKKNRAKRTKRKADEGNQKHEVLLGRVATVVDRDSRPVRTKRNNECK